MTKQPTFDLEALAAEWERRGDYAYRREQRGEATSPYSSEYCYKKACDYTNAVLVHIPS